MPCKSVLIVEDDDTIRETFKLALEIQGYTVFTAPNGKEGMELLLNSAPPGLILLDLMMPVMDGWSFMEIKDKDAKLASIPVVVLTAFNDKARSLKVKKILRKPVDLNQLLDVIRQYIGDPIAIGA